MCCEFNPYAPPTPLSGRKDSGTACPSFFLSSLLRESLMQNKMKQNKIKTVPDTGKFVNPREGWRKVFWIRILQCWENLKIASSLWRVRTGETPSEGKQETAEEREWVSEGERKFHWIELLSGATSWVIASEVSHGPTLGRDLYLGLNILWSTC